MKRRKKCDRRRPFLGVVRQVVLIEPGEIFVVGIIKIAVEIPHSALRRRGADLRLQDKDANANTREAKHHEQLRHRRRQLAGVAQTPKESQDRLRLT